MSSERQSLVELGIEAVKEGYGFFIGNTLSTLILAIGSIAIARLLGSENYGIYSLSFIIPSMLDPINSSDGHVCFSVLREFSHRGLR